MRILIDISHPVHVHLFKNFIRELERLGHKFLVSAREREHITHLLKAYNIPYVKRIGYKGFMKIPGMLLIDFKILREAMKFKPDIFIGEANPYMAQVAWFLGKPSFIFSNLSLIWVISSCFIELIISLHSTRKTGASFIIFW